MNSKRNLILILGFSIIITLTTALLVYSALNINTANTALQNVIQKETSHANAAHQLQSIADDRTLLLVEIMHENDPFTRDEKIQRLYQSGEQFIKIRQQLEINFLDENENAILKKQRQLSTIVTDDVHKILELVTDNRIDEAHELYLNKVLPNQRVSSQLLNQISVYQEHEAILAASTAEQQEKQVYRTVITGGLLLIVITILIGIFVYRHQVSSIQKLLFTGNQLNKANLDLENLKYALDQHAIVSITDTSGDILYVNDKFCEVSQYSDHELLGQRHNIVNSGLHPPAFFEDMWTTICNGRIWHGEIRNQKKDGTYYWVETSIVPFLDKNNIPYQYIAIRTEITHIKNIEHDLELSLERLAAEALKAQESSRLKDAIISTMTHELRTPLNSILGFSQLLMADKDGFNEIQIDNIKYIVESGEELLRHIDNIMLYSKIKAGSLTTDPHTVSINEIINSVISKTAHLYPEAKVKPVLTDKTGHEIFTDATLLQKALLQLVDNAVKFTVQGSIEISITRLGIGENLPGRDETTSMDSLLLTISDTGIGIDSDKQELIFEAFRQADNQDNRQYEGYGIGLSLAKSIIELLGGNIWITSQINTGTQVYMTLPYSHENKI